VLCREEEQEEGEEYELEENNRRAGEQGANLRRKGRQNTGVPKENSITCIFTIHVTISWGVSLRLYMQHLKSLCIGVTLVNCPW
jgi:hypothetical protein